MESDNGDKERVTTQTRINEGESWRESREEENPEEEFSSSKLHRERETKKFEENVDLNDIYFDIVSPLFQSSGEEISNLSDVAPGTVCVVVPEQEKIRTSPSPSLMLLTSYESRFKRLNGEWINKPSHETDGGIKPDVGTECKKLSTDEILRMVGEKFIQSPVPCGDELNNHSFSTFFSGISAENKTNLELVYYLLASAEKIGEKLFDCARKLLQECDKLSSCKGGPVQRLVYYFSEALHEKIDKEMGKTTDLYQKPLFELQEVLMSPNLAAYAIHQAVPFSQVTQFAGIQALLERVSEARKIHIIDPGIRCGIHFTILIQALAVRSTSKYPVEHLKITAIGTKSKQKIDETGKRLTHFAQSMNLNFSFNVIMVEDFQDLNNNPISIDPEEVIAIYAAYFLMSMIAQQDQIESLMRMIRSINPCVMVVIEIEGNHNSPSFVNRFIEALFFYGAYFDSLEDCMKDDEQNRAILESFYFSKGIKNMVAAEGEERTIRHVNIDVWRAFFARFGMVEMELSTAAVYSAEFVLKSFSCGRSCTIGIDGKGLIVGWKGEPVHSLSAWKFK